MKVCFNTQWIGKPQKDDDGRMWFKNKQVYLGYGWEVFDESFEDIFEALTVTGLAVGPVVKDGHRIKGNFVSHSLALVDIDGGMTIEELSTHKFYQKYGAGFYSSPSHTSEHHRFRVVFKLEKDITDCDDMKKLYTGLMLIFSKADTQCKDGARLFYGTVSAPMKEMREATLPDKIVRALIEEVEKEEVRVAPKSVEHQTVQSDEYKRLVIDLLQQSYVGNYETWRNIGWGLKHGGYDLSDFQYITSGMMSKKSASAAAAVWNTSGGSFTMGTVVHFLKERWGADWDKDVRKGFSRGRAKGLINSDSLSAHSEKWADRLKRLTNFD